MKITQHYPLLLAKFFPFFCSTLCLHPLLMNRRVVFTIPKVLGIARVVHSTNSPVSAVLCCSCQSRELDYCLEIAIGSNMWGRNISGKGRLEVHFPVLDSPWRRFINAMELDALSCSFLWALSIEVPAAWLSLPGGCMERTDMHLFPSPATEMVSEQSFKEGKLVDSRWVLFRVGKAQGGTLRFGS